MPVAIWDVKNIPYGQNKGENMKVKVFLGFLLTCVLLTACSTEIEQEDKIDLSKTEQMHMSTLSQSEDILAVFGDDLLLHNYDISKNEYLLFSKKDGKFIEYNDDNRCMVSSASFVNINNAYYISEVVVDNVNNSEKLRIIELTRDGEINTIREMMRTEEVSPFIYFTKYDKDSFLLIHRIGSETYIDMFECKERKFSRFLTLKSTEERETYLEKVSVNDEKVYIVVFEEGKYFLKVYDKNCLLINTVDLDIPLLKNSAILQFHVVGDLFIFENWNSEQALYTLQNNTLKEIQIDDKRIVSTGFSNVYEKEPRYIFLTNRNDLLTEEKPNNKLYALDLETQKIKCKEIVRGDVVPYINSIIYCENGNLVLSIKEDISSQVIFSYLLENEFLCDLYK